MRIAVACEGLNVSLHAGHCSSFMCYTVERGIITECQNLPNPGLPDATTADLLCDLSVDVLICGGIDRQTANALCHAGVEVVARAKGSAREVAESYVNHTLIGTEQLCHLLNEVPDAEDKSIDETFTRIEKELESTSH